MSGKSRSLSKVNKSVYSKEGQEIPARSRILCKVKKSRKSANKSKKSQQGQDIPVRSRSPSKEISTLSILEGDEIEEQKQRQEKHRAYVHR